MVSHTARMLTMRFVGASGSITSPGYLMRSLVTEAVVRPDQRSQRLEGGSWAPFSPDGAEPGRQAMNDGHRLNSEASARGGALPATVERRLSSR